MFQKVDFKTSTETEIEDTLLDLQHTMKLEIVKDSVVNIDFEEAKEWSGGIHKILVVLFWLWTVNLWLLYASTVHKGFVI